MNIFHKVTLQSLKKNRTRTLVTIIGVILSAAMITAVTTFASSLRNYAMELSIYQEGSWHGRVPNSGLPTWQEINDSDQIEKTAYLQQLGYAEFPLSTNPYKPYLYVVGGSENIGDLLPIHLTAGRMPQSTGEILLPEHLRTNGGYSAQIGDSLTLALGQRILDGASLRQDTELMATEKKDAMVHLETLNIRETRSYQVVGFYERLGKSLEPYSAPGYTALTVADGSPSPQYDWDLYFSMKHPGDTRDFLKTLGSDSLNDDVLMYYGIFPHDNFTQLLIGICVIVLSIILLGSVSLIYNAFSISASERTKQFGLLSSIGATKKQLAGTIRFEALVISAVGIPLGILSGVGGIGVTLLLLGDKIRAMGNTTPLKLHVSPLSIVIAALIALVTVLISAWVPSKRASNASAVESIRQTTDIKVRKKDLKTPKLTMKLFGLPGMLGDKYYKRSRRKYRTTVLSLFMSILLFVSASTFTDLLTNSVDTGMPTSGYDISFQVDPQNFNTVTPQQLLERIQSASSVTQAVYTQQTSNYGSIDPSYLMEPSENLENGQAYIYPHVVFLEDEAYLALMKELKLSPAHFTDPKNPLAVAVDGGHEFNPVNGQFEPVRILKDGESQLTLFQDREIDGYFLMETSLTNESGQLVARFVKENGDPEVDFLDIPMEEFELRSDHKIGAVTEYRPFYLPKSTGLNLVYPLSLRDAVFRVEPQDNIYQYFLCSEDHIKTVTDVKDILSSYNLSSNSLQDWVEIEESNRNTVFVIQVFATGFIVLISLIAAANVFNTISTNISLRRREFAVLRSVGMTQKDLRRMMNFECILYGSRSLLWGLPAACLSSFLIWNVFKNSFSTQFQLPWAALGIATLSVFAVVFASSLYAMGKMKHDSVVETLKNENI